MKKDDEAAFRRLTGMTFRQAEEIGRVLPDDLPGGMDAEARRVEEARRWLDSVGAGAADPEPTAENPRWKVRHPSGAEAEGRDTDDPDADDKRRRAALDDLDRRYGRSAPATAVAVSAAAMPSVEAMLPKKSPLPPGVKSKSLRAAGDQWMRKIEAKFTKPTQKKTVNKHRKAIGLLVEHLGAKKPVHSVTWADCENLFTERLTVLAKPTVKDEEGWLVDFFEWAVQMEYFSKEQKNPAAGHVQYSKKEKRERSKRNGFQAFTNGQLKALFAPGNLARVRSTQCRWMMVLALYAGARSKELAFLELADIGEDEAEGVPVLDFNLRSEFKELKTETSERKTPIHPELIELGLMERVETLRKSGASWLFPGGNMETANGPAAAAQRRFSRYRKELKIEPRTGMMGLHSFRDTVIGAMKVKGVPQAWREEYVGHDKTEKKSAKDTPHGTAYDVEALVVLAEKCHPALCWSQMGVIDIPALRVLLAEQVEDEDDTGDEDDSDDEGAA